MLQEFFRSNGFDAETLASMKIFDVMFNDFINSRSHSYSVFNIN